jgi:hypothetical protein
MTAEKRPDGTADQLEDAASHQPQPVARVSTVRTGGPKNDSKRSRYREMVETLLLASFSSRYAWSCSTTE